MVNKVLNLLDLLKKKDYINDFYIENVYEGVELEINVPVGIKGETTINIIEDWIKENGLVIENKRFIELYYCSEDKEAGEPPINLRYSYIFEANRKSDKLLNLFDKRIK